MNPINRTPSPQRLRWSGKTDRGKVRPNNEDSFVGLRFDAHEVQHLGRVGEASMGKTDFVFAVSDGMGGASAGEFASRITVDKITGLLPRSFERAAVGLETGFEDVFSELFDQIHRELVHLGQSYAECSGMGATLSVCWFMPGWMYFAHIGDSRIYYLPASNGGMKQISEDDTHVGWLLRRGEINERQARAHPRRNVLQKALGAGHQFIDPQVGAVGYEPGDLFLLCTDGLIEGLHDHHLLDVLRAAAASPADVDPAANLVDTSVGLAGRDNTTAVVVQIC